MVTSTTSNKTPTKKRVPVYIDAVAGGVAGLTVRLLTAPLDLLKIRLQLSPSPTTALKTVKEVWKNEGATAFFKGNIAATYLWVTYAAVQFGVYESVQGWLQDCEVGE